VPPEIVSSKSTWAPAPDAEMTPPLFMTTVSSTTLAFLPSAAIVLKLKILVLPALTNRPPLAVASSVPELTRVFGSPRKIASALPVLALIVPLLIRARFAAPPSILPAPRMVLALIKVSLDGAASPVLMTSFPPDDRITLPPPENVTAPPAALSRSFAPLPPLPP
jgi:hypothetical protein